MSWCVNARKRVLAFAQATALLRMIERDGKKLDVGAFLDRFQVVYSSAAEEGLTASESSTGRRVRSLLARVGGELLRLHGKSRIQVWFQFSPLMRIHPCSLPGSLVTATCGRISPQRLLAAFRPDLAFRLADL